MSENDFMRRVGGEVGGHVYDDRWECVCGQGGPAANDTEASLSLYFHRRQEHRAEGSNAR